MNVQLSLSFQQLAKLASQLPYKDRIKLASMLINEEPTKMEILEGLKEAIDEVNLAKQGKVKLKAARDFLNEL